MWISVPLEDDPVVALAGGGATYAHTVWARFYQRADKHDKARALPSVDHDREPNRFAYSRYDSTGRDGLASHHPRVNHAHVHSQVQSYVEDDLVECLAVAVCTTTAS